LGRTSFGRGKRGRRRESIGKLITKTVTNSYIGACHRKEKQKKNGLTERGQGGRGGRGAVGNDHY